jgi:hypothetical protein
MSQRLTWIGKLILMDALNRPTPVGDFVEKAAAKEHGAIISDLS